MLESKPPPVLSYNFTFVQIYARLTERPSGIRTPLQLFNILSKYGGCRVVVALNVS